jgi:hypothetical protein
MDPGSATVLPRTVEKGELTGELEKHLLATADKDFNDLDVHALAERLRNVTQIAINESAVVRENHRPRRSRRPPRLEDLRFERGGAHREGNESIRRKASGIK